MSRTLTACHQIAKSELSIIRQYQRDDSVEQRQAQMFQSQLSPSELAYQESLIQEREAEIREIETGIHELHEIFRDLGSLVNEQGEMLGMFAARHNPFIYL